MDTNIELWHYVVANVVVFLGALLQGSIGIGLAILAAPLLMVVQPAFVPVPIMFLALPFTLIMLNRHRRDVAIPKAAATLAGVLPGSILAGFVIWYLPQDILSIVFAVAIIIAVSISLTGRIIPATPVNCVVIGSVTGLIGTMTSLAGPPIALLFQKEQGPTVRGTIAAIYVFGLIISITVNFLTGRVDVEHVIFAAWMLPGLAVGTILSKPLARFFDRGFVRPGILTLSLFAAVVVLIRHL